jgi:hypothetical protein
MAELSRRDKESPYILIGAVVVGAVITQLVGKWSRKVSRLGAALIKTSLQLGQ